LDSYHGACPAELILEKIVAGSGQLTTYLGSAPGVGKTYTMLTDGRRRAANGERVVAGWVERHERPDTLAQLDGLEVIAPGQVTYRGHDFEEMDLAAVQAAGADVVIVDELAHTLPDGSRKRWMDVADLLGSGADVLTTVNVANLVSARDYAARLTGAGTVESVPDEFVRSGKIVLVDVPPDALRRRIASGLVYSADRVGGALAEYFRVPNLEALSALSRGWIEDSIEQVGADLLARRGLVETATRPLVIAAVSDSPWGEAVIKRAVELACDDDADLLVVHARVADGGGATRDDVLDRYRDMSEELGGSYSEVGGQSPAQALAELARARGATRVVVARHRSRLGELTHGSVASQLRRLLPDTTLEEVRQLA
jgi:two-component system, OmpR family, sensor histidine kinase KdpD